MDEEQSPSKARNKEKTQRSVKLDEFSIRQVPDDPTVRYRKCMSLRIGKLQLQSEKKIAIAPFKPAPKDYA